MSDNIEDMWQFDTSYYSASHWGFDEQMKRARKHKEDEERRLREDAEYARQQQEKEKLQAQQRQAAAERRAEIARALEELRAEKAREDAERKAKEEAERKALEEAEKQEAARIAAEEREAERRAEEERIEAERIFNSPKQIGDLVIPAPSGDDKKWLADLTGAPKWPTHEMRKKPPQTDSLWQFNHILENREEWDNALEYLFYYAAQDETHQQYQLLKHYSFSITNNYNAALRIAFENENRGAFDQLIEWGAHIENALSNPKLSELDKLKLARYAGITHYTWEKQDDETILRRHLETDQDDILTVRTVFNFNAGKIKTMTSINNDTPCMFIEGFDRQNNDCEILEAFEELKKQGGTPTPPQNFIRSAAKGRHTAVPAPHPGGAKP